MPAKSHIWGNSGSWVLGQNAICQWYCRILKSAIPHQPDFWHDDVNSRNIKDDFEIFNKTCPKEYSAGRFHDS